MKKVTLIIFFSSLLFGISCKEKVNESTPSSIEVGQEKVMSRAVFQGKLKGAWVAQTVGVTFGLPAEFKYNSTMIQDYQKLNWNEKSLENEFRERPGNYDDIYMDLSFMKVIEEEGIDAAMADQVWQAVVEADIVLFVVDARKNIFEQLLKLHFKLIDLTTEDEWKKISKSINDLY